MPSSWIAERQLNLHFFFGVPEPGHCVCAYICVAALDGVNSVGVLKSFCAEAQFPTYTAMTCQGI